MGTTVPAVRNAGQSGQTEYGYANNGEACEDP
jgi:hypothetical protein